MPYEGPAAWPAHEALKILDDPDVNPGMMMAENVTKWANGQGAPQVTN